MILEPEIALQALARSSVILDELVLIRPDIDPEILEQQIKLLSGRVKRTTIYPFASDPLGKSVAKLTSSPQFEVGGTIAVSGVDVVDVINSSSPSISTQRHLLVDLHGVLNGEEAVKRMGVRHRDGGWTLTD